MATTTVLPGEQEDLRVTHKATAANESTRTFHIGTRKSILARVQADEVAKDLRQTWPEHNFVIHAMSTTGDNNQKTALHKFNEKALWTQELEVQLQAGQLDLIVHSLKDMPTQLPVDLELGAVTKREDPRDAFVVKASLADQYHSLADLPEGSVVGTSSLRRTAQLRRYYPGLRFADVRGSIGTRLAKLDDPESEYSAVVIAVAGLARLGMSKRITKYLSKDNGGMLHAVGQGALGIETRRDDAPVAELLLRIGCERSRRTALVERMLMRTLEGGCSVPIGVETEWIANTGAGSGIGVKPAETYEAGSGQDGKEAASDEQDNLSDELALRAIVSSLDGEQVAEIETKRRISSREDAEMFGLDAARLLIEQGADKILEQVQLNRSIIQAQGNA